eukprot:TRINITY_DN30391_c0_g1_i2.p1 TRINITY_DN30391_c0_g1~~TRINITY_DN30391_c0_g1_i2.p1  ORF type:complete len:286 (+),score=50.33 TRINITY_DN30391_c0_g1_i2:119-859(+)
MPPSGTTALDLTSGITAYSSRIALKMMFSQFGEVTACWIPPLEHRSNERAYVKFGTTKAAQAAFNASEAGQLFLDGVSLKAEWRMAPARTQDARDFEAKGSNLMTSRDLMRAQVRGGGGRRDFDGGGSRALMMDRVGGGNDRRRNDDRRHDDRGRDRDRERERDKDRKVKDRERSRDRERKKSRSREKKRSRSREKKRKKSSSSSSSSDDAEESEEKGKEKRPAALENGPVTVDEDDEEEGTTAVI